MVMNNGSRPFSPACPNAPLRRSKRWSRLCWTVNVRCLFWDSNPPPLKTQDKTRSQTRTRTRNPRLILFWAPLPIKDWHSGAMWGAGSQYDGWCPRGKWVNRRRHSDADFRAALFRDPSPTI